MKQVIIFSGTSEGKEICRFLNRQKINTLACVATEYGKEVMEDMEYVSVLVGRKNRDEMKNIIADFSLVIDATHPYAAEVTDNIKAVCKALNKRYLRVLRNIENSNVKSFHDIESAVEYLKTKKGNIFAATGSKEIQKYGVLGKDRIFARVLPVESSKKLCEGFKNVLYVSPPFSYEDNIKHFQNCKYLVTKNSGSTGGFYEKIKAAHKLNMEIIIISPPKEDMGVSVEAAKEIILNGIFKSHGN